MEPNHFTDITLKVDEGVARICLNRPEKFNAIRLRTYAELQEALRAADEDSECRVILLEGSGGQFTAGNDLADLAGGETVRLMQSVEGIFNTVAGLRKVLVAAVEGVAVGIGTTILLYCDLVVASEESRFRLPFVNLGVCPEGGSSMLLPQVIGQKRASELLLTGRFFTAVEALQWGLINRTCEPGQAVTQAMEYVTELSNHPLNSLTATKALLKANHSQSSDAISAELQVFSELLQTTATQNRLMKLLNR